jgi:tetratricopeptide (TPR) repeat protein
MDQFQAHLDRGWDLIHRGDLAGAQRSAEKSVELDAESPEALNLLGYVCAAQGNYEQALEHYRQAIALDDSFVEAMLNAAEVLIHPLHDFDAAVGLIDDALEWSESDDEVADALLLKFDAYMHKGDDESARKVLRTLPEGELQSARLYFLIGRAHFEVGEIQRARAYLERALGQSADVADVHYYLGLCFDAQGEHEAATLEFLRCRELDTSAPRPPGVPDQAQFERSLRRAVAELDGAAKQTLDGALVVVSDLPGAEVVADGVDPRAPMLLDALGEREGATRVGRVFVYQRNVERMSERSGDLEADLVKLLEAEIAHAQQPPAPKDG